MAQVEGVSYLEDGTPIEYCEVWYRGDKCKFAIEVVPTEGMKKIMSPYKV